MSEALLVLGGSVLAGVTILAGLVWVLSGGSKDPDRRTLREIERWREGR